MIITNRPYTEADLPRLHDFVVAAAGTAEWPYYIHRGDLLWWLFQNTVFEPSERVRLWESAGELVGHAWHVGTDELFIQVHPRVRGAGEIEREMVAWALQHADAIKAHGKDTLWLSIMESDQRYHDLLGALGFTRGDARLVVLHQRLEAPPPPEPLPAGFVVRHVGEASEWPERVDLHRELWQPSKMTLEAYQRLRASPGYIPELDLVAVAPDGTLAAYCTCWIDPVNRRGLFEPVGTRAAFRQQRLGRAVMLEGLRRLHARGAHEAQVLSIADNAAAVRLYESVGFVIIEREHMYGRKLSTSV